MSFRRLSRRTVLMLTILIVFFLPVIVRAALFAAGDAPRSWRDADWSSTGMLPRPPTAAEARVLVVFTGTHRRLEGRVRGA